METSSQLHMLCFCCKINLILSYLILCCMYFCKINLIFSYIMNKKNNKKRKLFPNKSYLILSYIMNKKINKKRKLLQKNYDFCKKIIILSYIMLILWIKKIIKKENLCKINLILFYIMNKIINKKRKLLPNKYYLILYYE